MSEELMGKRLLEIFKQKYNQGDSYYVRVNNKGDKFIVGYKNDYPMQHGDGVEWMIPIEVVEMLVSQVEPEVILQGELLPCPFCGDEVTLYKQLDRCFLLHTCEIIKSGFGEKNIIESKSKQSLTVIWNKRAGREPKSK